MESDEEIDQILSQMNADDFDDVQEPKRRKLNFRQSQEEDSKESFISLDEVLEFIFKYLDVPTLQICRQVCKSWNHEASFYMRKRAEIFVETEREYRDVISALESREKFELPLPFQDMQFSNFNSWYSVYMELGMPSCLNLTSLKSICTQRSFFPFLRMLQTHGTSTIRSLVMTYNLPVDTPLWPDLHQRRESWLEFSVLESLKYHLVIGSDLMLLQILYISPKLRNLHLSVETPDSAPLTAVLTKSDLTAINKLRFDLYYYNGIPWPTLQSLHISALEVLEVNFICRDFYPASMPQVTPFVKKFTQTLKHLSLSGITLMMSRREIQATSMFSNLRILPNLISAKLPALEIGTTRNRAKFPQSLIKLSVDGFTFPPDPISTKPMCKQIKHLDCGSGFFRTTANPEIGLIYLGKLFPNARTWDVECCVLSKCLKNFPTMKLPVDRLRIYSKEGSHSFSDCDLTYLLTGHLSGRVNFFNEFRTRSGPVTLTDFGNPNLHLAGVQELLVDVKEENLSIFVFENGFAKMKNLKILGLRWNGSLRSEFVVKNLPHLKKLYLDGCHRKSLNRNFYDYENFEGRNKIFMQVPNVVCACKDGLSSIFKV